MKKPKPPAAAEFSRLVYAAAEKIPRGRVASYAEIARAIGRPRAARATGQALKHNPFAPVVPCHRVVRSNGEIGGYAGGTAKKAALLGREGIKIVNKRIADFKYFIKIE